MKKMIPVMMLSGIIGLSACGNKTEQPQQNADTLEVADTIKEDTAAVDTPQTAEVQENAQEEKTVEKNVKSTQAGGTTIAVKDTSSPLYGYFLYRGLEKYLFPAGDA